MAVEDKNLMADFSPAALRKKVLVGTAEHPSVLFPGVIGLLGLAGSVLIEPNLLFIASAIGGALLGAVAWGANYGFRQEHFAKLHIDRLVQQIEGERIKRVGMLEEALKEVDSEEGHSQFRRMSEKFEAFRGILDRKLVPGELTHARYLGIAEQVYLSALDNLNVMAGIMRSIGVIDDGFVQQRLGTINAENAANAEQQREYQALQKRLDLRERQMQKVSNLLAINEEAMTQMDLTIAAIVEMTHDDRQASLDMETAMSELGRLAERAKDYS